MLVELEGIPMQIQEDEQISFVCLLILTMNMNTAVTIDHHLTMLISILTLCLVELEIQMVHSFSMWLQLAMMVSNVHHTCPIVWCPVLCVRSECCKSDLVTYI